MESIINFFKNLKFSETIILTLLPIFGYLSAYVYFSAFYGFFNIPSDHVSVGLETVILSSLFLFIFLCFVLLLWLTFNEIIKMNFALFKRFESNLVKSKYFSKVLIMILVVLSLIITFSVPVHNVVKIFGSSVILIKFISFLRIPGLHMNHNNLESLKEKEKQSYLTISKNIHETIITLFPLAFVVFSFVLISFLSGIMTAQNLTKFSVISKNNKFYILTKPNNDYFVAVEINKDTNETTNDILIIKSDENISINIEKIGRINRTIQPLSMILEPELM